MSNRRFEKAAFLCLVVLLAAAGLFSGEVKAAIPNYNCALQDSIPQEQCDALVAIYESTNGADWTVNTNWLETDDPCNWHGVSCVGGTVVGLDLFNNNLTGELPLEIGAFIDLETLTVNDNPLEGPVPMTVTLLDLRLFHFHNSGLCEPADPTFQDWLFGVVYRFSNGTFCTPPVPTVTPTSDAPTSTVTLEATTIPTSTDFPPQQTLTAMAEIAATELASTPDHSPTPTKYYSVDKSPTPEPTSETITELTLVPDETEDEPGEGLLAGISQPWLLLLLIPLSLIGVGLLLEYRERRIANEVFDDDDEVEEALFKLDYFDASDDDK